MSATSISQVEVKAALANTFNLREDECASTIPERNISGLMLRACSTADDLPHSQSPLRL